MRLSPSKQKTLRQRRTPPKHRGHNNGYSIGCHHRHLVQELLKDGMTNHKVLLHRLAQPKVASRRPVEATMADAHSSSTSSRLEHTFQGTVWRTTPGRPGLPQHLFPVKPKFDTDLAAQSRPRSCTRMTKVPAPGRTNLLQACPF